jgi:hypothetical protein
MHGYMVSSGLMDQCKMWRRSALKTLQFNWQWNCWDSVISLHTTFKKSVWPFFRETDFCKTSSHNILQHEKMGWMKRGVKYPPQSPDLTPLHFYLWVHFMNTAGPETQNWNCISYYTTSNPARSRPLCCTLLLTMLWGWWWTSWTSVTLR